MFNQQRYKTKTVKTYPAVWHNSPTGNPCFKVTLEKIQTLQGPVAIGTRPTKLQ